MSTIRYNGEECRPEERIRILIPGLELEYRRFDMNIHEAQLLYQMLRAGFTEPTRSVKIQRHTNGEAKG